MRADIRLQLDHPRPICTGAGYVALDVVINGRTEVVPHFWTGGSCGNVLSILSYIGWQTYPIARLGNDAAGKGILEDMQRWGLNVDFVFKDMNQNTPIVIEKLHKTSSGEPVHRFQWKCPNCGSDLPRYRPVLASVASEIISRIPTSEVFYFDRLSPSTLKIAAEERSRGALVVFEPSGVKNRKLFRECLKIAHIVKYSYEQLSSSPIENGKSVPLEVQTLGAEGLRYRLRRRDGRAGKWNAMKAFHVPRLIDSVGAGDWCTAGMIHCLGREGAEGFQKASEEDIKSALELGQGMAALKCRYLGARGLMYTLKKSAAASLIYKIMRRERFVESIPTLTSNEDKSIFRQICNECSRIESINP